MSTTLDLDVLAKEMKAAQDSVRQIEPFTKRYQGFDLSCAYEVGALIHHERIAEGATPVGRKIGFTNSDMWSKYGVCEPIWAYVYDTTVVHLQGSRAKCSIGRFTEPKIEPEIVFRFCSGLSGPVELTDVIKAIDWVAHGFEIVQSHFPGWRFQAPDTVADWALHGTLLIGPPKSLHKLGSGPVDTLASLSVELTCDDNFVEKGTGSNVLGNPLAAIVHLVSVLGKQSNQAPIKAGEIVTTGTITTAQSIYPGQTWRSEIKGGELSNITVEFEP